MKTSQIQHFKYKLPAINAVLMVLVTLAATAGIGYVAYAGPTAGITRMLSRELLQFVFWGLAVASVFVIWVAIRTQSGVRYVEIGLAGALVPKASLSMTPFTIPYGAITQVQITNIHGQQMATISSPFGESRLLSKSFATPSEFTSFMRALQDRCQKEKKEPGLDLKTAALINAVRERSKEDPLVGAKLGAKEVFQRILGGIKNEKGVHIESLLCALGALAGYSCQASLRAQALAKNMPETAALQTVETNDGKQYFFGDPLNNALAGSQYSVWGLAGGAAQQAGAKELPDLNEIFQHTASVVGSDQFGIPRVPDNHRAGDTPINYLKAIWPTLFPTVQLFCPNPVDWSILYALATQEAIDAGKSAIDPAIALKIVMESAIPMSKVDLVNS